MPFKKGSSSLRADTLKNQYLLVMLSVPREAIATKKWKNYLTTAVNSPSQQALITWIRSTKTHLRPKYSAGGVNCLSFI